MRTREQIEHIVATVNAAPSLTVAARQLGIDRGVLSQYLRRLRKSDPPWQVRKFRGGAPKRPAPLANQTIVTQSDAAC